MPVCKVWVYALSGLSATRQAKQLLKCLFSKCNLDCLARIPVYSRLCIDFVCNGTAQIIRLVFGENTA